jgi:NTP pyrophosphatase (non-canonical NTP hydrolase)
MTYYLYHIPGKKVGVTTDLKRRVEDQQGYGPGEYEIIESSDDIDFISEGEIIMQKAFGYKVDQIPYNKLNCNKNKLNMNINITEQTTTFPCPANKLKGQLMDNMGMKWTTEHGEFIITPATVRWIMKNIKTSMFNDQRSYVYNKAFARFYDNNDAFDLLGGNLEDVHMRDQYNGKTIAGGMSEQKRKHKQKYQDHDPEDYDMPVECCDEYNPCACKSEPQFSKRKIMNQYNQFDLIRAWAMDRGLYDKGDIKTQTLKLMEEAGEICKATLKEDHDEVIDGIGDCVVVLTNLAYLNGVTIEDCIQAAYDVISKRTGKMVNGTFKKD